MIRLRTLGAFTVESSSGEPVDALLRQPKRLALLAFLSCGPGELATRERVCSVFWPAAPSARAHGNLRNALYFLSSHLGRDALVRRGQQLGTSPALLWSDSAELLSEPQNDAESRLKLYHGDFLEGFHLSGLPEFERWVDRMRARLRARAAGIATQLSSAAEDRGEWITAAGFARTAAELEVDTEAAHQRLIGLLARAGDRGAAMAAYERLSEHLRREFDVAPSPESQDLVQRIRSSGGPPDGPAVAVMQDAHAPLPMRGEDALVVLPFEDRGGDAATYLAGALAADLRIALGRLMSVRVVSRTSVTALLEEGPPSVSRIRECLGATLVLEGSVRVDGTRAHVEVHLIDAKRDHSLWSETFSGELTELLGMQHEIGLRLARTLRVELSPQEHQWLRLGPTRDLEAYECYLDGRSALSLRRPESVARALELFKRSLERDASFPLALAGLADAHMMAAGVGAAPFVEAGRSARAALERSLALDPHLGEARAGLGMNLVFWEWDLEGAQREFRRAVDFAPGFATGHQWYGQFLALMGNEAEALTHLNLAIRIDPLSPAVSDGHGKALWHLGDERGALEVLERTLRQSPRYWRANLPLAGVHAACGELEPVLTHLMVVWEAGALGSRTSELRRARAAARPSDAAKALLQGVRTRLDEIPATRIVEVMLLVGSGSHGEAMAALHQAERDRTLGLLVDLAPLLDPLATQPGFAALMHSTGLMLPRWL